MKIALVCDTTCDIPLKTLEQMNVKVIPLKVNFGDDSFLDQYGITAEEFYDRMLASEELPTTSQPSPAEFSEMYDDLVAQGYESIVSIHLSSALSGTCNSAYLAAETCSIPVEIIDSLSASAGVALVVEEAVALRDSGVGLDSMVAALRSMTGAIRFYFIPDTLENLVKGGRAGKAQGVVSDLLNIKLLISLNEKGSVEVLGKGRGAKNIVNTMSDLIEEYYGEQGPLVAHVQNTRNPAGIRMIKDALAKRNIEIEYREDIAMGAVIATHGGMGSMGIALVPATRN